MYMGCCISTSLSFTTPKINSTLVNIRVVYCCLQNWALQSWKIWVVLKLTCEACFSAILNQIKIATTTFRVWQTALLQLHHCLCVLYGHCCEIPATYELDCEVGNLRRWIGLQDGWQMIKEISEHSKALQPFFTWPSADAVPFTKVRKLLYERN